jgi:hypothetical protein
MDGTADIHALRGDLVEYDIDLPSQRLKYVRFTEYFLVFTALVTIAHFSIAIIKAALVNVSVLALVGIFLLADVVLIAAGVVAYLSCGKLRPNIWRLYPFILPLAALSALWKVVLTLVEFSSLPSWAQDFFSWSFDLACFFYFALVPVTVVGTIGALRLKAARVLPTSWTVFDLLMLSRIKEKEGIPSGGAQRISLARGVLALSLGLIFILTGPLLAFLGFFFLLKSRQYLQVSPDSLLSTDDRKPILFLRSFMDDPFTEIEISWAEIAKVLDFSLETRLANYFMHFGPFIAVGLPQEELPVPGATRVHLG